MNSKLFLITSLVTLIQLFIFHILVTEASIIFKIISIIPLHCVCYVWYHAGKAVGTSDQVLREKKLNELLERNK